MTFRTPGARLLAAAGFARRGRRIADIGTDHAYLPVFLVGGGVSVCAEATDINRAPLERAAANIAAAGLSDRITVRLADGLDGVGAFAPEDIFILGMGGELIASILERAVFLHDPNRKTVCILQAMTSETDLRRYLAEHGFAVLREVLVKDKGRIYSLIACRYDGIVRKMSEAELCVGIYHVLHPDIELFLPYMDRKIRILSKKIAQMTDAGLPCEADKDVLCELQRLRETALRNGIDREN